LEDFPSVRNRSRRAAAVDATTPIRIVCPQEPAVGGESFGEGNLKRVEGGGVDKIPSFSMGIRTSDDQSRAERTFDPNALCTAYEQP
jgi:hypothetical protein